MSSYGPALFIARKDDTHIDENEQKNLLEFVKKSASELGIQDEQEEPAEPHKYEYAGYEKKSLSILIYSGYAYGMMPEHIAQDYSDTSCEEVMKIATQLEATHPGVYQCQSYFVES